MAAVVGSVLAKLMVDQSGLTTGLAVAGRSVTGFEGKVGRSLSGVDARFRQSAGVVGRTAATIRAEMSGIGKNAALGLGRFSTGLVGAVAGLVTFSAATAGARRALDQLGQIADRSDAAGLDPEVWQAVALKAQLAGVEIESTAGALEAFAKASGQAAEGRGKLLSALKATNPELLRSLQLTTSQEERLKLVADAIANAKSQAEAAALASAAFGDAGVRLVSTFRDGGKAIDDMVTSAKAAGAIVETELVQRADALGDSLDAANTVVSTQLNRAFVNLAPILIQLSQLTGAWLQDLNVILDQFQSVENRVTLFPLQNELVALENTMAPLRERIAEARQELEGLAEANPSRIQVEYQLQLDQAAYDDLMAKASALQQRIYQLQGMPSATSPVSLPSGAAFSGGWGSEAFQVPVEVKPSTFDFRRWLDPKVTSTATKGLTSVKDAVIDVAGATAGAVDQTKQLSDGWAQAEEQAQSFASTFISDMRQGKTIAESLSDSLSNLADSLLQLAAQQGIKSLFGALASAFGGGVGVSSFVGTGFGSYGLYAGGGYVSGPGTSTSDSIPARLSDGEYVVRASATRKYKPLLEAINNGKVRAFANGGPVGNAAPTASLPTHMVQVLAANAEPAPPPQPAVLQVIDQRKNGGTIKTQESRGPRGERLLRAYILDTVGNAQRYGVGG